MDSFLLAAQLLLAAVFAFAGAAKLFDLPGSRRALVEFGVPERAAPVAGLLLPLAELAIAVALVLHPTARWAGLAAFILLLAFIGGIANAMRRGRAPDCNCFGQVHSAPAGSSTLARNGVLAVLAAIVAWQGPAPAIDTWVADRTGAELLAIGLALVVLAAAAWALRRWSQQRARRRAIAAAISTPDPGPEGLPVGTPAPSFALPDVRGGTQTLESLRARGRPVMIEFMDLSCAPCRELLPAVARWQTSLAERVTIAIITGGSVDERSEWDRYGVANVLLDNSGELYAAYRAQGTPKAFGIWQDGSIAAAPAGGMHMPEVLMRILLRGGPPAPEGTRAGAATSVADGNGTAALPVVVRVEPGRA
jgi:thiol-disulfide isomerase/thioredoxin